MNANEAALHLNANAAASVPQSEGLPLYLTLAQVSTVTTLGRSSIYNRMNDASNPLPRPLRAGRRVMWSRDEVLKYMNDRLRERDRAQERRQAGSGLS